MAIIGSILVYPAGGLRYIDALFFASGSATQSGLNTVDLNLINTYQQVVLYFIAMVCNPIFINSFVVFVRLYWFEKRFQNVVREARNSRRTRSRTKTDMKADRDIGHEEKGVNGRSIVVMHGDGESNKHRQQANGIHRPDPQQEVENTSNTANDSSNGDSADTLADEGRITSSPSPPRRAPSFHRDIVFADEVKPVGRPDVEERLPEQRTAEQHIAFLENQRNPKDKGTLRIPGPRDFDRGVVPETVADDEDGGPMARRITSPTEPETPVGRTNGHAGQMEAIAEMSTDDQRMKRNISIDEPQSSRARTQRSALSRMTFHHHNSNSQSLPKTPTSATAFSGLRSRGRSFTNPSMRSSRTQEKDPMPYLSWQPTIGRNSAFIDLTEEQREELGGIEYRALKTLALILVGYFVCFHLFGIVSLLPWIERSGTYGAIVVNDGVNKAWWAIFTTSSLFNDVGFTLTPDSMISFQTAVFPLLLGCFLIVIGNTGFPCMLRFVIWVLHSLVPRESGAWEELKFLLDHPRRCFTLLFPSKATWWLFWILVALNGIDLLLFCVLDIHNHTLEALAPGTRVLTGLFQAFSTRTAGFSVVNLSNLHTAVQVSYLVMMYISVFPIAISVRRTNVYEEKSLGIYGASPGEDEDDSGEPSYVGAHLRRQLSFDLWYIFLGLFIIAIAEGPRLENTNEYAFTTFSCLFEIVSAYGTVGLSLGYPNINASFSAEFSVISKLVIIAMQIRGRHRGLPYQLDRAVLLPSEGLHKKEDRDAALRMRRNSTLSQTDREPSAHQWIARRPTEEQAMSEREDKVTRVFDESEAERHRGTGNGVAGPLGR
ncbi:MAG: low affinity potassium transporter, partial [Candelina submexicana]